MYRWFFIKLCLSIDVLWSSNMLSSFFLDADLFTDTTFQRWKSLIRLPHSANFRHGDADGGTGGFSGGAGFPLPSCLRSFLMSCAAPFSFWAGFCLAGCSDTRCALFSNPLAFCGDASRAFTAASCGRWVDSTGAFFSNSRAFVCESSGVFTVASFAGRSNSGGAFFSNSLAFRCDSSWPFAPGSVARCGGAG